MNIFTRVGDKYEKKEKKSPAEKAASTEPMPHTLASNQRRENPTAANIKPGIDFDHAIDGENEITSQLQSGKRRTVSISRSGKYRSKHNSRGRILSDDVYSGTKVVTAVPVPASAPIVSAVPMDLVKPTGGENLPAHPYIILKCDTSVAFAIESTSL